jgi:predicted phosphodiesterase
MRLLRIILLKPVLWAAARFSSRPKRDKIFAALSALYQHILQHPGKKGLSIPFESSSGKFIIFSDQHKGRKNGADDFMLAEANYIQALQHYAENDFYFINLGDCEELWENNLWQVKKMNKASFEAEKKFIVNNKYIKIFGNHDLFWDNDPWAGWQLKSIYGEKIKVYEGAVLVTEVNAAGPRLTFFLTHGHQGDRQSDGNWFSKFFVSKIWAPLQAFLRINPNTPAYDAEKKTLHNSMMYEWSHEQENIVLVTGHTHQPVFASLTHLERLYKKFQQAETNKNIRAAEELKKEIQRREKEFTAVAVDYMNMKPSYFNTGCCCFSDGDITGIEIADGCIRLIKWKLKDGKSIRICLEENKLADLVSAL